MDCAISTIARKHDYIHALLAGLQTERPIHLVVGSPESKFLDRYRSDPRFRLVEVDQEEWRIYKDSNIHHRATFNYWRCLECGSSPQGGRGLLVLEDDVIAARGWRERTIKIVQQAESKYRGNYAIAFYSPYRLPVVDGTYYAIYPTYGFYGTQAIYYPEEIRRRFADYLRHWGVDKNHAPYDMLLKAFLETERVPLLSAVPSLFQHVGRHSTGLGSFHEAPDFQPYLDPGMNPLKWMAGWRRHVRLGRDLLLKSWKRRKHKSSTEVPFPDQTFQADGMRVVHSRADPLMVRKKKEEWKAYLQNISDAPKTFQQPRGIVICAGGVRYLTCAYINIRMLRHRGCSLPIELWHLDHEMSKEFEMMLKELGVECRNLREVSGLKLRSFQTKPFAILYSKFREVLFLDADNVATRDPSFLFDCAEYKAHGAVFWPDYWRTDRRNAIWNLTESEPSDSYEFDSGQILVDKARCWKELSLCCHFNQDIDFYYSLLNGDKDTFKFAWLALKTPYRLVEYDVAQCGFVNSQGMFVGTTMVQHDFDGKILFLHRNLCKWDTTREGEIVWQELRRFKPSGVHREYYLNVNNNLSMVISGDIEIRPFESVFPGFEQECLNFLRELREGPVYVRFLVEIYIRYFRPR